MLMKKIFAALLLIALAFSQAEARPHYHRHGCPPCYTRSIKSCPNSNARFEMAVRYLHANKYMSVSQYAKMTGLKKKKAEAELDMFARNRLNPIVRVTGKKKLYALKR